MLIGLSGTNWTRKSTTIGRFVKAHPKFRVIGLGAIAQQCPFPTGSRQVLSASRWVMDKLAEALGGFSDEDFVICDRTCVDIMAYSLLASARTGEEVGDHLRSEVQAIHRKFYRVMLCVPAPPWPEPVQPSSEALAHAIELQPFLEKAAATLDPEPRVGPWDLDSRLDMLEEWLRAGTRTDGD